MNAVISWKHTITMITRQQESTWNSFRITSQAPARAFSADFISRSTILREGSETYGQWYGVVLSAENKKQFFIPKNFAHGFVVLSDTAEFAYKCTDFYHPNDEGGLAYNDPDIGVQWPIPEDMELILSDKDQKWGSFKEYTANRGKKD